jgi:integrase
MALICVCFGLRISEALALKWGNVDWLNAKLQVERGIVADTENANTHLEGAAGMSRTPSLGVPSGRHN